jgi:hypothetical protein
VLHFRFAFLALPLDGISKRAAVLSLPVGQCLVSVSEVNCCDRVKTESQLCRHSCLKIDSRLSFVANATAVSVCYSVNPVGFNNIDAKVLSASRLSLTEGPRWPDARAFAGLKRCIKLRIARNLVSLAIEV